MATLREQPSNLGLWPRYANNLQTLAFGHATRTTFKPWPLATLREQPSNLKHY
ncbi:hypothetical protein [Moorena bouillonii]|uniref:hypothetical protein n=1 Tax=Moorena bouillonii TaxID=207920 RepID=UPI001300CC08|nr:hypothetical protein [Moorena bouillonii]